MIEGDVLTVVRMNQLRKDDCGGIFCMKNIKCEE